jgi:hypothetical protein
MPFRAPGVIRRARVNAVLTGITTYSIFIF